MHSFTVLSTYKNTQMSLACLWLNCCNWRMICTTFLRECFIIILILTQHTTHTTSLTNISFHLFVVSVTFARRFVDVGRYENDKHIGIYKVLRWIVFDSIWFSVKWAQFASLKKNPIENQIKRKNPAQNKVEKMRGNFFINKCQRNGVAC